MHVAKLRLTADDEGPLPAGTYFARLAAALREANERAGNVDHEAKSALKRQARTRKTWTENEHAASL